MRLTGTPTSYGSYNISIKAKDSWNGSAVMSFEIIAGIRPNSPPVIGTKLQDKKAYRKELFYYKLPDTAFNDSDGDTLYYLVS